MARGTPLTVMEKYAMKAMFEENMSVSEIAAKSRRSETLVRKFLNEELKHTTEFLEQTKDLVPKNVETAVIKQLTEAGMQEFDARAVLKIVKGQLKQEVTMDQVDALYKFCLNKKSPKDLMITKATGGRKGVAIMTSGASEVLDDVKQKRKPRVLDSCIYRQEDAE